MERVNSLRIAGPLTLDSDSNTAYIAPRAELRLSPDEFDVLYILAAREDMPLTFEQLYDCLWEQEDGACRQAEARKTIAKVVRRVNAAGNGFVWIERHPSLGYTFRTRWGHNRETWQETAAG